MSGRQVDSACYLAAIGFFASSILRTGLFDQNLSKAWHNDAQWKDMEGEYLESQWKGISSSIGSLWLTYGIVHVLAWLILATILFRVAWIQSAQGTARIGPNSTVAFLGASTAIIELLVRMLYIGSDMSLRWMASDFQMGNWYPAEGRVKGSKDEVGWMVLESVAIATQGMLVWADTIEYVFLAIILILIHNSAIKVPGSLLTKKWANFGLVIAAICTLDFYAEVLRFVEWGLFSHISLYISSTNQIVFFPAWLIWLGIQLAEVPKFQQEDSAVPNDLQLDHE